MLTVKAITDIDGFRALREEWNELAAAAGLTIFQTWEWSWHWWKHNSRGKRLWLLVASDGRRLAGIAPLYIASSCYGLPVKVAAFIGTNGTDYLDFIAHRNSLEVIDALTGFMLDAAGWDAIDLHQLPDGSSIPDAIGSMAPHGSSCDRLIQDVCYNLILPGSYEEYEAGLSKKFRWNVNYYTRRLARDYDISYRLSDSDTVEKDMGIFLKLHQKRFVEKRKPGAYLSPKFRKFHGGLAADLCNNGWLRLYIFEIGGSPAAALYGFQFGKSFYYYLGGFEADWGAMSVSTVLIARAIQDSICSGLNGFDFLRGNEPYKQKWLAKESPNFRLIIGRPGKKADLTQKILSVENGLTRRIKDKIAGRA